MVDEMFTLARFLDDKIMLLLLKFWNTPNMQPVNKICFKHRRE